MREADRKPPGKRFRAVVIGASLGGLNALARLFSQLGSGLAIPIVVVQHICRSENSHFPDLFKGKCAMTFKEAGDKERIVKGTVYFAPPDYHILVERDGTISLSIDEKVNFSRPSIDVLFESAAHAYGGSLVGIVLTGANRDGAAGLRLIRDMGGFTVAQDPEEAEMAVMPQAAIDEGAVMEVMTIYEIGELLKKLVPCEEAQDEEKA